MYIGTVAGAGQSGQPNWTMMLLFSALMHCCAVLLIFLVPGSTSLRGIKGPVYEVELVSLAGPPVSPGPVAPLQKPAPLPETAPASKPVPAAVPEKPEVEKLAPALKTPEKPVPIAKRTVDKPAQVAKPPKVEPDKLLDQKLERTKEKAAPPAKKPAADKPAATAPPAAAQGHVDKAIERLERRLAAAGGAGGGGGGGFESVSQRIYTMEVQSRIAGNWSYPVAMAPPEKRSTLEMVVLLKVRSDGTILETRVSSRSDDAVFDQSVMKAVERSDPLPAFPEGLGKVEEFQIRFNLSQLEAM